jgi:hypothetical protein
MTYQKEGVNISAYINEKKTLRPITREDNLEDGLNEKSEMLGFFRREIRSPLGDEIAGKPWYMKALKKGHLYLYYKPNVEYLNAWNRFANETSKNSNGWWIIANKHGDAIREEGLMIYWRAETNANNPEEINSSTGKNNGWEFFAEGVNAPGDFKRLPDDVSVVVKKVEGQESVEKHCEVTRKGEDSCHWDFSEEYRECHNDKGKVSIPWGIYNNKGNKCVLKKSGGKSHNRVLRRSNKKKQNKTRKNKKGGKTKKRYSLIRKIKKGKHKKRFSISKRNKKNKN